jgi:hypothetical protein
VSITVHIHNRAPTRALDGNTTYEAWHGEVPAVHYLRTFGCVMHVKIMRPGLKKLDDRSFKAIFIGYEQGSKAYSCYNPNNQHVIVSHDIVFDEVTTWDWSDLVAEQGNAIEPFIIEYDIEIIHDVGQDVAWSPSPGEPMVLKIAHPGIKEDDLNAEHDDALLRVRSINDVIGDATPPRRMQRVLDAQQNFISTEEPSSFHEAEQDVAWHAAMLSKIKAIEENDTWELATLPPGHHTIGLKWV